MKEIYSLLQFIVMLSGAFSAATCVVKDVGVAMEGTKSKGPIDFSERFPCYNKKDWGRS